MTVNSSGNISDDELDEIERRCEAASPPPWEAFVEGRDHSSGDDFIRIARGDEPDMYVFRSTDNGVPPASSEDLDFIAHARQDITRLIAEVRRLRTNPGSPRP
ncbi:hypothetical protein [Streptomyces sp. NPDC001165]|uniref:hypothetical protein n=1 Tax=Streptomyces sp. NPDC001165 TaxID=3364546 RepID=UPI0036C0A21E